MRLEDTDKKREIAGSEEHLIKSLKALGIDYDEGPDIGGQHGPYRQSERLDIYKAWANKLIEHGRAYVDPYTPEEVDNFRRQAQQSKQPFLYKNYRPGTSTDSTRWDGTKPLRFKSDPQPYTWHDAVMGNLHSGPEVVDDFILVKTDGYPTYNFAHIIDDTEMQISHVIRGQEFLPSVPNYLNLYEALGATPPIMATVPHILAPDGKKKLSKRDGAKDVMDYIRQGFLPEALVNFISTLGWNDGTEQEIFTVKELIEKFSLDRVQKSGAHFDENRLTWINGHHIRQLKLDDLYERAKDYLPDDASKFDESYKKTVLSLVQERLKYFAELPNLTNFFFMDLPVKADLIKNNQQLQKLSTEELINLLNLAKETLEQSDFSEVDLSHRLNSLLENTGQKPAVLFSLIRIATTQAPASPGLAETLTVLGKETVQRRITATIEGLAP